jgi:archaellum component FlaC
MSEAVGIVVIIGTVIVALISIFIYWQVGRFSETWRIQLTRFVDATEDFGKDWAVALKKLGDAADGIKSVSAEMQDRLEVIEKDIVPLAHNLNQAVADARPGFKSLTEGSDDIKATIENIRYITDDISDVTEGIHGTIMPLVNGVRAIVTALTEGLKAMRRK